MRRRHDSEPSRRQLAAEVASKAACAQHTSRSQNVLTSGLGLGLHYYAQAAGMHCATHLRRWSSRALLARKASEAPPLGAASKPPAQRIETRVSVMKA